MVFCTVTLSMACPGFFIIGKTEGPEAESRVKFLERGQQPPPHQLEGLGERCELPQRGSGGRPDRPTFSHYFQHSGSVCLNTADHRR